MLLILGPGFCQLWAIRLEFWWAFVIFIHIGEGFLGGKAEPLWIMRCFVTRVRSCTVKDGSYFKSSYLCQRSCERVVANWVMNGLIQFKIRPTLPHCGVVLIILYRRESLYSFYPVTLLSFLFLSHLYHLYFEKMAPHLFPVVCAAPISKEVSTVISSSSPSFSLILTPSEVCR